MSPRFHVPMLHRGTGFSGPETARPKSPFWLKTVSAETETPPESPPIAGYLPVFEKFPSSKECVVADAVVVKPVSASSFPANREKNREICNFRATSSIRRPTNPMISALFS